MRKCLLFIVMAAFIAIDASFLFAMANTPPRPLKIEILEHSGKIKITKPYGGTLTINPGEELPAFIPIGSRIEVITGTAKMLIGEDTINIDRGEIIYFWGDEASGSLEYAMIPVGTKAVLEPIRIVPEEVSVSAP